MPVGTRPRPWQLGSVIYGRIQVVHLNEVSITPVSPQLGRGTKSATHFLVCLDWDLLGTGG